MQIKGMSLGMIGTNCYILFENNKSIIIDPGAEPERVAAFHTENQLKPKAILLTHAHFDHIGAVDALRNKYHIPVFLHEQELDWLDNPALNGSSKLTGQQITAAPADELLKQGTLLIDEFTMEVLHTPGHSPGSVSFVFPESKIIFGGDVLFKQGIGRTDLPGGNSEQLVETIKNTLYSLDGSFVVYPGHGPETTIDDEKKANPFVRG